MANHYCTYFDRNYLVQGLAMWRSLERRDPAALLWVLALDEVTQRTVADQGGERLRIVPLQALLEADAALARVRSDRPAREFFFTLSPCWPRHLFAHHPEIERVAYLDADLFFLGDPDAIWRALGEGSVLITPHAYPSWHDDSDRYGRFNVGVVVFRRDHAGTACLEWWRERCLESCRLDADNGVYGDQKYLDEWPDRFEGVVTCGHPGINLAPWNWAGRRVTLTDGRVHVDEHPLVVFHFAQFRRVRGAWFDSGQLEYGIMPRALRNAVYEPYWRAMEAVVADVGGSFARVERGWRASLGGGPLAGWRWLWGQYWWRGFGGWWSGRAGLGCHVGRIMGIYRRWQRRKR